MYSISLIKKLFTSEHSLQGLFRSVMAHVEKRARILVLATGSVACVKIPSLIVELQRFAEIKVVCTDAALHFLRPGGAAELYNPQAYTAWRGSGAASYSWPPFVDAEEWGYSKIGDPVLHIDLRKYVMIALCASNVPMGDGNVC